MPSRIWLECLHGIEVPLQASLIQSGHSRRLIGMGSRNIMHHEHEQVGCVWLKISASTIEEEEETRCLLPFSAGILQERTCYRGDCGQFSSASDERARRTQAVGTGLRLERRSPCAESGAGANDHHLRLRRHGEALLGCTTTALKDGGAIILVGLLENISLSMLAGLDWSELLAELGLLDPTLCS